MLSFNKNMLETTFKCPKNVSDTTLSQLGQMKSWLTS